MHLLAPASRFLLMLCVWRTAIPSQLQGSPCPCIPESRHSRRLDGFEAHFLDLRSPEASTKARESVGLFGNAVCGFLSDGVPDCSTITVPTWLKVDGGYDAADALVRSLAWKTDSNDPFGIGAHTVPSQATFSCTNLDTNWTASIMIARSLLPDTQLFLQVGAEYRPGSGPENFVDRAEHVAEIWNSVAESIGLTFSRR